MYYVVAPTNQDIFHHGVLGMKWGIRRYQPYSVVPRESGKTGKEIGIAKRNVKAAYRNAKKAATALNAADRVNNAYKQKRNTIERSSDSKWEKDRKLQKLDAKNDKWLSKHQDKINKSRELMDKAVDEVFKAEGVLGKEKVDKMLSNREIRDTVIGGVAGSALYATGVAAIAATTGFLVINPYMTVASPLIGALSSTERSGRLREEIHKRRSKDRRR